MKGLSDPRTLSKRAALKAILIGAFLLSGAVFDCTRRTDLAQVGEEKLLAKRLYLFCTIDASASTTTTCTFSSMTGVDCAGEGFLLGITSLY